jgi:hypothetical protein
LFSKLRYHPVLIFISVYIYILLWYSTFLEIQSNIDFHIRVLLFISFLFFLSLCAIPRWAGPALYLRGPLKNRRRGEGPPKLQNYAKAVQQRFVSTSHQKSTPNVTDRSEKTRPRSPVLLFTMLTSKIRSTPWCLPSLWENSWSCWTVHSA